MPIPFQSASWKLRAQIPSPTLFGALSGAVQGVYQASFDKNSKVVQTAGPLAHNFTTWFGASQASLDEGKTWFSTYQGTGDPADEYIINTFSLDTPSGTYHYQVRVQLSHSFFAADGSINAGGIRLYATDFGDEAGTTFFPIQTLYSWPNVIANPANTPGSQAGFNVSPSFSKPILIPGSGPAGEDAFWAAASYDLQYGGTNNRSNPRAMDIWRSLDGFVWQIVRDLKSVSPFNATLPTDSFGPFIQSTTGKIFLVHSGGLARADTQNLLTTTWVGSATILLGSGWFEPMFGGTWASSVNGSLIGGGHAIVSCDDGINWPSSPGGPPWPVNAAGFGLKVGPTEVILIVPGFSDPSTQTTCWYSADGGETYAGGEVWLASNIGERPVALFLKSDGKPLCISTQRAFISSDSATGIPTVRFTCPLANAGLAVAKKLVLCGGVITPDCHED